MTPAAFREQIDDSFWPTLGYVCGSLAGSTVPLLVGLERVPASRDDLKAFCAAFGTTAAAALFHMRGHTPGAYNTGGGSSDAHRYSTGGGSSDAHEFSTGIGPSRAHGYSSGGGSSDAHWYSTGRGPSRAHWYTTGGGSSGAGAYGVGVGIDEERRITPSLRGHPPGAYGVGAGMDEDHMRGHTPGAYGVGVGLDEERRITPSLLSKAFGRLNGGECLPEEEPVQLVAIGSPHLSAEECAALASLARGRLKHATVRVDLYTILPSPIVYVEWQNRGSVKNS